ncbi:MAG: Fe-S cluster assembly protein SufB [Nanoarchaeota archaeon]
MELTINREIYDHSDEGTSRFVAKEGLTEDVVRIISTDKQEPKWLLDKRLKALALFRKTPMMDWGPSLNSLDLDRIVYYVRPDAVKNAGSWDDVPVQIKNTFERLGIPEAERKSLAGVGAQYDSEVVYHSLRKELADQGVIFVDMDIAVKEHPELMKKYFMTNCVPISDHKFVMLHAAVWSGGTFIYVPPNVKVTTPLQAYFRMNARKGGQFEHTLIIADEGSEVQYIEGCSAPQYNASSIHAGCVELYVHKNAKIRYSSVENWSRNTFNLNTKRAIVEEQGTIEWVGGNLGSGVTMLYPCSILKGRGARADHLSIAYAGQGQNQDTGAKVIHLAPDTSSMVRSKSISKDGGITTYRGVVKMRKGAFRAKTNVECDGLLLDEHSVSRTFPSMVVEETDVHVGHEARVGRISEELLFYVMSRGISQERALSMIVAGFMEPIVRELPLEYAVEMNKLIELEMENAVG